MIRFLEAMCDFYGDLLARLLASNTDTERDK